MGGCQTYRLIYNYQPGYCNIYKASFQDFLIGTFASADVKGFKAHNSLRWVFIQEQEGQSTNISWKWDIQNLVENVNKLN